MANTAESGFSPVRQFDPYTRPRPARWPIAGRLSQCLLQPVHVWLTAKLTVSSLPDREHAVTGPEDGLQKLFRAEEDGAELGPPMAEHWVGDGLSNAFRDCGRAWQAQAVMGISHEKTL